MLRVVRQPKGITMTPLGCRLYFRDLRGPRMTHPQVYISLDAHHSHAKLEMLSYLHTGCSSRQGISRSTRRTNFMRPGELSTVRIAYLATELLARAYARIL
ncbi:hypothetical protein RSAG8_04354, partial [Rhizoctonia solani AG-8 WAC10335]